MPRQSWGLRFTHTRRFPSPHPPIKEIHFVSMRVYMCVDLWTFLLFSPVNYVRDRFYLACIISGPLLAQLALFNRVHSWPDPTIPRSIPVPYNKSERWTSVRDEQKKIFHKRNKWNTNRANNVIELIFKCIINQYLS